MKSKRHQYIKAFSVAILILICTTVTESWAKEPYKIGGVFPMKGAAAFIGKEHLVGVKIAIEQINAKGGIDGRKLEIVAYDTAGKPAETVSLIKKLVQLDKVLAIIGPSINHTSLAALPLASRYKIPLINLSGIVQVNKPFNPWAFRIGKSNEVVAAVISDYMKKQNINRVCLITVDTMGGKSFEKAFTSLAFDRGIEIVKTTSIHPETRDVSPLLISISKSKPEAILAWLSSEQLLDPAKILKALKLKQALYLGNVLPMRNFIEAAKEVAENIIVTSEKVSVADQLFLEDLQRPLINNYIEHFKKLHMKFPPELGGPAYDAAHLLAEAMRGSEGKKERIRDSLEQIKGFAGVGGVYSFSRKNHSGLGLESLSLVQIRDGKPYLVYSAKGCPQGTILCSDNICREICD